MVETYNGKSPRNARIKIDYTGECPSVQFKYPRKDGFEGSMRGPITAVCAILAIIGYLFFSFGISYGQPMSQNETQINDTNVSNDSYEESDTEKIPLKELLKPLKILTIFYLFIFVLPWIIDKIFKKKLNALFPIYQAWKASKKYVEFKAKDIKTSNINGKKEIYVEIPYFENVILKYEATKDFSKYLTIMEIKEHNFKTKENHKRKNKKSIKVKKQNEWYWNAKFYFNKIPKDGKLSVVFK